MRSLLDQYDERMMIGEIYLPIHKLVTYYGVNNSGAHLPFNFMLISLPWQASVIASAIDEYEGALPQNGWPNWVLGNHDQPRITSRVGVEQARIAAMLLLTLRGTPTIYYGEEIGMRDVPIPFEEVQDPQGLNMPDKNLSRDPARTPMQWSAGNNAGFSDTLPWLRIDKSFSRVNVDLQQRDPNSMLSFYTKLIQLRQSAPSLMIGSYIPVYSDNQAIAYRREHQGAGSYLIILNFTHRPFYFNQPVTGKIAAATADELVGREINGQLYLSGDEGMIIALESFDEV
jgi:alpha-glucosidase